jgi:DNA-directed RNA polymerase subunit RPC12/RpoP
LFLLDIFPAQTQTTVLTSHFDTGCLQQIENRFLDCGADDDEREEQRRYRVVSSLSVDSNDGYSRALSVSGSPPIAPHGGSEQHVILTASAPTGRGRGLSTFQQSAHVGTGAGLESSGVSPAEGTTAVVADDESKNEEEEEEDATNAETTTSNTSTIGVVATAVSGVLKAKHKLKLLRAEKLKREPKGVVAMWSRVACRDCEYHLLDEEIMAGWSDDSASLEINCPVCGFLIIPKLKFSVCQSDRYVSVYLCIYVYLYLCIYVSMYQY